MADFFSSTAPVVSRAESSEDGSPPTKQRLVESGETTGTAVPSAFASASSSSSPPLDSVSVSGLLEESDRIVVDPSLSNEEKVIALDNALQNKYGSRPWLTEGVPRPEEITANEDIIQSLYDRPPTLSPAANEMAYPLTAGWTWKDPIFKRKGPPLSIDEYDPENVLFPPFEVFPKKNNSSSTNPATSASRAPLFYRHSDGSVRQLAVHVPSIVRSSLQAKNIEVADPQDPKKKMTVLSKYQMSIFLTCPGFVERTYGHLENYKRLIQNMQKFFEKQIRFEYRFWMHLLSQPRFVQQMRGKTKISDVFNTSVYPSCYAGVSRIFQFQALQAMSAGEGTLEIAKEARGPRLILSIPLVSQATVEKELKSGNEIDKTSPSCRFELVEAKDRKPIPIHPLETDLSLRVMDTRIHFQNMCISGCYSVDYTVFDGLFSLPIPIPKRKSSDPESCNLIGDFSSSLCESGEEGEVSSSTETWNGHGNFDSEIQWN